MKMVTRSAWGARPAKQATRLVPSALKGVAVHYTAMNADEQSDHANCAARVKGIQTFHLDSRKWSDIAYNFLVCKHGYVFQGRGFGIRSAAQGTDDGNDGYHAVCFLGDDTANRDDVTADGRDALTAFIRFAQFKYPHAKDVLPHSSFHPTACPGDELRGYIAAQPWTLKPPKPKGHKPPWQLLHGRTELGKPVRFSKAALLFPNVRRIDQALRKHGKVTLREKP